MAALSSPIFVCIQEGGISLLKSVHDRLMFVLNREKICPNNMVLISNKVIAMADTLSLLWKLHWFLTVTLLGM